MPLPTTPRFRRLLPSNWQIGLPGLRRKRTEQPVKHPVAFNGQVRPNVKAARRRQTRIAHASRKRNQQLAKAN